MIQEDYVTFDQAKLLKEKGFPQPDTIKGNLFYCEMPFNEDFRYSKIVKYNEGELLSDENLDEKDFQNHSIMFFDYCPSLSLVQKWFRYEKKIFIEISPFYDTDTDKICYKYTIYSDCENECEIKFQGLLPTVKPEETLSAAIDEALKLI